MKNARQERERREKARRSARKNRRIYTDSSPSLRSDRTIPPSLHVYRLGFLLYFIKFPFEFLKIFWPLRTDRWSFPIYLTNRFQLLGFELYSNLWGWFLMKAFWELMCRRCAIRVCIGWRKCGGDENCGLEFRTQKNGLGSGAKETGAIGSWKATGMFSIFYVLVHFHIGFIAWCWNFIFVSIALCVYILYESVHEF